MKAGDLVSLAANELGERDRPFRHAASSSRRTRSVSSPVFGQVSPAPNRTEQVQRTVPSRSGRVWHFVGRAGQTIHNPAVACCRRAGAFCR